MILFIKAPLLSFTVGFIRIYYAALKIFKIYDSTTFDFSDDEDRMDHLSKSSGGEADW